MAVFGDDEAVRDDLAERRPAARAEPDEERALEPAAMLIASLEVDIGRPGQLLRNGSTASWLDPESNQTSRMSRSRSNSVPPHVEQVSPSGMNSAIGRSYHASAP